MKKKKKKKKDIPGEIRIAKFKLVMDKPFSKKFKPLRELELKDVEIPDYVFLTYAVCACDKDSCGWGGWMIEAAFKRTEKKDWPTGTGDKLVSSFDEQICPNCGKATYRTGAEIICENPTPYIDDDESLMKPAASSAKKDS